MTKELEIEKFSPTVAELQKLVSETKDLTLRNYKDVKQLAVIKENRLVLKSARVAITKKGKDLRQEALEFQRKVISREKELLGIIEPEENRLSALEDWAFEQTEQERRIELIPRRHSILDSVGDEVKITDEELVKMDDKGFDVYLQQRRIDKIEQDKQNLEIEKLKLEEEKKKIELEKEIKAREEKAREEEREKAKLEKQKLEQEAKEHLEQEEKQRKERIVREEQEAKERILKAEKESKDKLEREEQERKTELKRKEDERIAEEKKTREEKEKLEKEVKYQKFLKDNGYDDKNKGEYIIENYPDVVYLFKKIATFKR